MKRLLSVLLAVLLAIGFAFTVTAEESAGGTCGENLTWEYDGVTGTLTISGEGAMEDYPFTSSPWGQYKDKIQVVVIGDGVTSIGQSVFDGFDSLKSVKIGSGIKNLGADEFSDKQIESFTVSEVIISS